MLAGDWGGVFTVTGEQMRSTGQTEALLNIICICKTENSFPFIAFNWDFSEAIILGKNLVVDFIYLTSSLWKHSSGALVYCFTVNK